MRVDLFVILFCTFIVYTKSYVLAPFQTTSDLQTWTPSTTLKLITGGRVPGIYY